MVSTGNTLFPGMLAYAPVPGDRFGVRVAAPVIQVHTTAAVAYLSRLDAHVHQALSKFTILSTVLHALIKTIDSEDMFFPGRRAVSVPGGAGNGQGIEYCADYRVGKELCDFWCKWYAVFQ